LLIRRQQRFSRRVEGLTFGLLTLVLAILTTGLVLGFDGVVAPSSFIVLGTVLFVSLFMLHGVIVAALTTRWTEGRPTADNRSPADSGLSPG
jgi:phosphotransferase system  glucose/maltose/N-acetylglucosamine-specific IIC component